MFELNPTKQCVEVELAGSGDILTLYYRAPTNAERLARHNELVKREAGAKKTKIVSYTFPISVKYGSKLCTGFETGVLALDGKMISSDPAAEDYCAEWKGLLEKACPDAFVVVDSIAFRAAKLPGADEGGIEYVEDDELGPDPSEPSTPTSTGAEA